MRLIFFVSACCTTLSHAQEVAVSVLDREVHLSDFYEGDSRQLISLIEQESGLLISYSNRVYSASNVKLDYKSAPLRRFLDDIFVRYPVDYIEQGEKVIVALRATKLYTVCGFCRDALSGESLIGANVYDSLIMVGQSTNGYGFFSFKLPAGKVPLCASYVGYKTEFKQLELTSDTMLMLRLQPMPMLADVDVLASGEMYEKDMEVVDLPVGYVKNMPSLLGESDVIRAFQMTPGVQSGEEGFGGMSVRGGSADQNILLLDDVPLYSSSHMMGLYSIFNIESVNKAKLVKGGFPARYGGRLSSVVDIKTKEGNMQKYGGYVNIGLLSSNATLEGPIIKDKMSFIVSGRRTYFDIFSAKIQNNNDNKYSFYFYDVTAKLNYIASPKDRIYLNFLAGYDHFNYGYNYRNVKLVYDNSDVRTVLTNDNQKIKWGSLVTSLRWNHIFGSSLFLNCTSFYSRYRSRNTMSMYDSEDTYGYKHQYFSGIQDIGHRADFTWYMPYSDNVMRYGVYFVNHAFSPSVSLMTVSEDGSSTVSLNRRSSKDMYCLESYIYCEDEFRYNKLSGNVGLHLSLFKHKGESLYMRLEPRLSLCYDIMKSLSVKVSYTDMTQFMQLARIATVASPADIWLPISSELSPPRSWQLSSEVNMQLGNGLSFVVETYRKKFVHALTHKSSVLISLSDVSHWDKMFVEGEGVSNGIELFLQRTTGRLTGWLGYGWCKSESRFDEINNGKTFPSDNDRTHSIVINGNYKITDNMDFGVSWNFNTGAPVTISDSRYVIAGDDVHHNAPFLPIEGERNGYRMPNSHTLSMGFNIHKQRRKTSTVLSFGIYNVYSQKNPMFVYWGKDERVGAGNTFNYKLKQFSLIAWPWPYLRYSIKF